MHIGRARAWLRILGGREQLLAIQGEGVDGTDAKALFALSKTEE